MKELNSDPVFRQFKFIFIVYVAMLAAYSYWTESQKIQTNMAKSAVAQNWQNHYLQQVNQGASKEMTGVILTSHAERFVATQSVPDWANNLNQ